MNHQTNVTQNNNVTTKASNVRNDDVTQIAYDQRLKPKLRKHTKLWQLYLLQQDLVEFRKRVTLRQSSAEREVSNLSAEFQQEIIDIFSLDQHCDPKNKAQREGGPDKEYKQTDGKSGRMYDTPSFFHQMVLAGQEVGPIWDWLLEHKGIGPSLTAKTLALIDDIEKFPTVAKLWRYAGYGLNDYWCDEKGKAICPKEGWKWVEIKKGKKYRIWTVVSDQACDVIQEENVNTNGKDHSRNVIHVPHAIPIDKQYAIPQNNTLPPLKRVDFLEPDPKWELKTLSDRLCKHYHAPYCTPLKSTLFLIAESFQKSGTIPYKDQYEFEKERLMTERNIKRGHAHNMAWRKVKKEFLKQLWLAWRQFEGLETGEGYKA